MDSKIQKLKATPSQIEPENPLLMEENEESEEENFDRSDGGF
jgi:hypothetical protein